METLPRRPPARLCAIRFARANEEANVLYERICSFRHVRLCEARLRMPGTGGLGPDGAMFAAR